MKIFKKHFKKSDSYMHCDWVKHDGYGLLPRLVVNKNESVYIYFLFTWWKLNWYWVKERKELNYE